MQPIQIVKTHSDFVSNQPPEKPQKNMMDNIYCSDGSSIVRTQEEQNTPLLMCVH